MGVVTASQGKSTLENASYSFKCLQTILQRNVGEGFLQPKSTKHNGSPLEVPTAATPTRSEHARPPTAETLQKNLSKKVPHLVTFILVNSGHFWSHLVRCELSITQKFVSEHPSQTVTSSHQSMTYLHSDLHGSTSVQRFCFAEAEPCAQGRTIGSRYFAQRTKSLAQCIGQTRQTDFD